MENERRRRREVRGVTVPAIGDLIGDLTGDLTGKERRGGITDGGRVVFQLNNDYLLFFFRSFCSHRLYRLISAKRKTN